MSVAAIASAIRRDLRALADPVRRDGEQRYFKETIRSYGVNAPDSYAIARAVFREHRAALTPDDWFTLAERLLGSGWFEEGTIGLELIARLRPPPTAALFRTYARWLREYVGNWAHCDKLCSELIGALLVATDQVRQR